MQVKTKPQSGVALVEKAFLIMDMFQSDRPTWSQVELVHATELNRSTVNRLVRFLESRGYLNKVSTTGQYTLGTALIELGMRASAGIDLKSACQPEMNQLAQSTGETIVLCAYDSSRCAAVCINQIEGQQEGLRVFERIGSTLPLHAGAAPRSMLAYLPKEQQAEYLTRKLVKYTDNTAVDIDYIKQRIEKTRTRGYETSWEETFEGAVGMAAPILGARNIVMGSLGVDLPINRAKPDILENVVTMLLAATTQISSKLKG